MNKATVPLWAEENDAQKERVIQLAVMNKDDKQLTKQQQCIKAIKDELTQSNRCKTLHELRTRGLHPLGDATYAKMRIHAWRAQQPANPAFANNPANKKTWRTITIWGVCILGTVCTISALGFLHNPNWFIGLFPLIVIAIFSFLGVCWKLSHLAEEEWLAVYEDIDSGNHLETIPEEVLRHIHELTLHLIHGETFQIQHVFLRQYHNWQNARERTDHPELGGLILLHERQRHEGRMVTRATAAIAEW